MTTICVAVAEGENDFLYPALETLIDERVFESGSSHLRLYLTLPTQAV